ncbi:recombinase family protein [Xanthomonas oryzae]|uniref:recombinase family protein n=1 Tax=Xanthomonas oryzae TaxID=347 RepID=UPI000DE07813|nr:recombinase family protein [Xanthomonas oryzae]RBH74630.1 transposon DNA-invertase [Xanthomonas oryzae pv. oryzae]
MFSTKHRWNSQVSTDDQNLDLQRDALAAAGCGRIFVDTASGAKADRPGLADALDFTRSGDVLVVWRLDRLGRSLKELVSLVDRLSGSGVGFESLNERLDTTSASGELVFHIFGAIAQFERRLMVERTRAGLHAARARGRNGGRPSASADTIRAIKTLALTDRTPKDICKALKISRSTFYKYAPARAAAPAAVVTGKRDQSRGSVTK